MTVDYMRVLFYVRRLMVDCARARPSEYREGYMDALRIVEEYIVDRLWNAGVDSESIDERALDEDEE